MLDPADPAGRTEALRGRTAVVTGASRGIGREIALSLARAGADVAITARTESPRPGTPGSLRSVADEIERLGVKALPLAADLSSADDIQRVISTTLEEQGEISVLVHNAGSLWWHRLLDTPLRRFDQMLAVHVRASFVLCQAVLPPMIEQGGGHIVLCSPPVDPEALPGRVGYLVSKFGMTHLALGLAEEVREQGISVNALWPATLIESQATINQRIGARAEWRKPTIVADACVQLVSTPPGRVTGRALLDEDVLREAGVTDFAPYRADPEHEPPRLDLRTLPEAGEEPPGAGGS